MDKLYQFVLIPFFILIAGLLSVSCSGNGNPLQPSDSTDTGDHKISGIKGLTETTSSGIIPPGTPMPGDELDYAPGQVLLTLRDGFIPADSDGKFLPGAYNEAVSLLNKYGLEIRKIISADWGTVYVMNITDGSSVPDKVTALKNAPEVLHAEPNGKVHFLEAPYVPNDPLWENPNDLDTDPRSTVFEQFGPSKIGASYVWEDTRGEGMVVCVIDTGIQIWHEDLSANMWINADEIPSNGIDDDSNGYIDDIYGWDTDTNDNDITDYGVGSYHGTGCSGVVAATQDNNKGCSGIAPAAKLMGIRIGFNSGFYSAVIQGVEYARNNGADIISMSFITTYNSPLMKAAMDAAWADGIILCGGAGNNDGQYIYYPCTWDSVVKVGATSPFSQAWAYKPIDEVRISVAAGFGWGSTYGNGIEIMGFGEHYITTHGEAADKYWNGNNDLFFGGTSNATPMIAASFALLKSYYPGESAAWLRTRLSATADDVMAVGFDNFTGNGRVNLIRAVYGSDRYKSEEDANGFVDLAPHNGTIYDSLHYADSGDYIDTEDFYKFTAGSTGYLSFDLDIFTWGENFDLELYSDPSLAPEYKIDSVSRENHLNDSHELVGTPCKAGETFYVKVFPALPGDSSAYGLTSRITENFMEIQTDSNDPGFIHQSGYNKYVGYIEFNVGFRVHVNELIISARGPMPTSKLAGIHLYRDADGNKTFGTDDIKVADASFNGTNRAVFSGLNEDINLTNSPLRYFITIDISGVTENAYFELLLTSYKDIQTAENVTVAYNEFPRVFGPFQVGVDITPPTWNSTIGIQSVVPKFAAALLYWNAGSDPQTPPVKYNVYWTQTLPFDFATANHIDNIAPSDGGDVYDYTYKLTGLVNNELFHVAIRIEDQAGNEDQNTVYLDVIPTPVSDPTAPQIIGSYDTPGSAWEVKVDPANQRVFVADYNGGILIIDVSSPTNPFLVDSVYGAEITGIDYDGTYVYAAGGSGIFIVNPDGPDGAELVKLVSFANCLDVQVVGNWLYATNYGTSLFPLDISNPLNPIEHPKVTSGQYGYGMDAAGGYLYVATNQKPKVFNISNPSAPVNTGANFGDNYAYELDVVGDRLYVTYWFEHKFSIYSLSNPAEPSYIGGWKSDSGYDAADIVMFNGFLYFGTNSRHIEVLNVTDPASISEIGQILTDGPDGLDTDDMFVYSAENEHGLKIII